MNLHKHIRKVLRETVNESTFFRRRVDTRLVEKEFFENLNYVTDAFITKLKKGISFDFDTFKRRVINNLMDDYHNELSDGGLNDFPYDEIYEFLSDHFHDKIKDRYDLILRRNINESQNEEDPTQKILNFLLRRYEVEEYTFGDEERPITIKMLRIKNGSGQSYSIRSTGSKKEQIRDILETLMILNVIDEFELNKIKDNSYAQKAVRAVKMFYDKVMGNKSNMNEGLKDMFKNMFGKKPLTNDDRLVNVLVKFIKENYSIEFDSNDKDEITYYDTDYTGVWWNTPIMKYYPKYKRLEYSRFFAEDIYSVIGDNRLLDRDSEMMGKIFEKLYKKKVDKVNGYSRI